MPSVTFKSIMLNVIMLNVVSLNVVTTFKFMNYAKKTFQGKTL